MTPKKIVITGGPSTGKTTVIERLGRMGYPYVPELIREMTLKEKKAGDPSSFDTNPILSVQDPLEFNRQLLEGRIRQFHAPVNPGKEVLFFDRGIIDVMAYMDCFGQEYDERFTLAGQNYRYDGVLLLPPWEGIHQTDDERFETYSEAVRIDASLRAAYIAFGYEPIIVPPGTVDERIDFIMETIVP